MTSSSPNRQQDHITDKIDNYLKKILSDNGVPGATLAIIKDGKVIHQQNYGYANLEHEVPVSDKSIFRLYSLSKPIFSVSVFKLIEQGKLNLEDEISLYLEDLPKVWNAIKIKHLLTYSSGLPDMAQPYLEIRDLTEEAIKARTYPLSINFEKGDRFEYSQANFWLLQRILEKVTKSKVSDFVLNHQFSVTAAERYENFIIKYPAVLRQVPQKQIASYLGITPEFLSTIRSKRTKK